MNAYAFGCEGERAQKQERKKLLWQVCVKIAFLTRICSTQKRLLPNGASLHQQRRGVRRTPQLSPLLHTSLKRRLSDSSLLLLTAAKQRHIRQERKTGTIFTKWSKKVAALLTEPGPDRFKTLRARLTIEPVPKTRCFQPRAFSFKFSC